MNTNIILRRSTKVEGNIASETCDIGQPGDSTDGPLLSVTDEDVFIKCKVGDEYKTYKLSEVVEAILELDRRTAGIIEGPSDNSITGDTTEGGEGAGTDGTNPDG